MEDIMRRTILLALAAGAIFVAACTPEVTVQNEAPAPGDLPSGITVSGSGEVYGTPDTLEMSFGVSVQRPTVQQAVDDAAALADTLISTLEGNGVATEDIQTAGYSISPQYDYSGELVTITGYEVDNVVAAKIRDVSAAGSVIDAVAANGSDEVQVSGVSFSIEDDEELIAAARAAAWADAEAKAGQLADLAGVTLGRAVMISESFSTGQPVPLYRGFDEMAAVDAAPTPIEPGQQQVAVSLQVRFTTTP
jgi:uncharacterized protein YggE